MSKQEETNEDNIQNESTRRIEFELSKEKKTECRNIAKTINEFGVTQKQKLFLIHLLALELENRDVMLSVSNACMENHTKLMEKTIVEPPKKKILLTD